MALVKAEEMTAGFSGLNNLSSLRQIGLLVGLAASVAIGVTLVLWSWSPNYGVLYGALEEQDVSTIMDALQQNGIEAKLDQNSGAVLVPADKIHDARIKMASMGLPKGVSAGFDALDEKNNFGVSQFMESARYQHALEVELARTVGSLSSVKSARVHLAIPKQSVFVRDRKKPSASVVVNLFPGRVMEPGQVASIVHMVSSSVPNLETNQVTVVDQKGKLLTNGQSDRQMMMSSAQFEYTQKVENSLSERVRSLLEPLLGAAAVRAQVTADIDFTVTEQTQESFNPDSAVLRSNQTTEERSTGSVAGGIPGALSNQPPAQATAPETAGQAAAGSGGVPSRSHRREVSNFEVDKTISHTRLAMGRLHRLSVAVVVDDKVVVAEDGVTSRIQRTPEELARLTDLVKKAVGFNAQRGDSVNIMNASFTVPPEPEPLPEVPIWEQAWLQDILKKLLGVVLVLVLFFGVLKPVMHSLARHAGRRVEPDITTDGTLDMISNAEMPTLPSSYGANMEAATQIAKDDPKLVAQVVKSWVREGS